MHNISNKKLNVGNTSSREKGRGEGGGSWT